MVHFSHSKISQYNTEKYQKCFPKAHDIMKERFFACVKTIFSLNGRLLFAQPMQQFSNPDFPSPEQFETLMEKFSKPIRDEVGMCTETNMLIVSVNRNFLGFSFTGDVLL